MSGSISSPGSKVAREHGCICDTPDLTSRNAPGFLVDHDCPLHGAGSALALMPSGSDYVALQASYEAAKG